MVLPSQSAETLAATTPIEPIAHHLTPCDQSALRQLRQAFVRARPLAVVTGEGRLRFARVFEAFVAGLDANVDVVRFPEPSTDAKSCMRNIVSRIGFDTKDFSMPDLENILFMFLAYQKTHGRRTIICVEQADRCSSWVLDKLCALVQKEADDSCGLLVVLAGRPHLSELLRDGPLQSIARHAGRPITIAPLRPAESKTFVNQYLESIGVDDPGRVIEYEAVAKLHAMAAGVPDALHDICARSVQRAESASAFPISTEFLDQCKATQDREFATVDAPAPSPRPVISKIKPLDRIVVRSQDDQPSEYTIDNESIAVGRDPDSGIHLPGKLVSRNHALLVTSGGGVKIVDLGSTNGTYVNGDRIDESQVLEHGDSIEIGGFRLTYLQPDGKRAKAVPAPAPRRERTDDGGSVLARAFVKNLAKPEGNAGVANSAGGTMASGRECEAGMPRSS